MGHSQTEKARSHERILEAAASQIREAGLESISVAQLMRSVNLTHGGFYGHFASRSELLTEALERALIDGSAASQAVANKQAEAASSYVRAYLSRSHRDSRKEGCAVAALASDVARADEGSRKVMESYIERLISRVGSDLDADDEQAMFAASAMVGGLLLSRVLTDPERSDAMLKAVRNGLADRRKKDDPPARLKHE